MSEAEDATGPAAARPRRGLIDWLEARFHLTETVSLFTSLGLLPVELDRSKPLREAFREALARPVPSFIRFPRILGILSLQLCIFLILTGVLLGLYYLPTPESAHTSLTTIVRDVTFGWLIQQTHRWAATLLVLILLARLVRFFVQGLYKTPREGLWMVALGLLTMACLGDMTGRLLAWHEQGFWTTVRAMEVVQSLPLVGSVFSFVVGGNHPDPIVLLRFYVLHAAVIPGALLLLFHVNLIGVARVGIAPSGDKPGGERMPLKVYLLNSLLLSLAVFGVLVTLAVLVPAPFGTAADPFRSPGPAGPPWYLLAPVALRALIPAALPAGFRGLVIELLFLLALLLPFLDRGPMRPWWERKRALALGLLVMLGWLALTWYGYRLEATT